MQAETWLDELMEKLEEAEEEARGYRRTLERVADILAEIGLISPTPHAKRLFVDGEREL